MADVFKTAINDIANMAAASGVIDQAAQEIAAKARARAAGHGSLAGDIKVVKAGKKDRLVIIDHEAGAHIEMGHLHNKPKDGPKKWVPGLHVLRNALYNDMPDVG